MRRINKTAKIPKTDMNVQSERESQSNIIYIILQMMKTI